MFDLLVPVLKTHLRFTFNHVLFPCPSSALHPLYVGLNTRTVSMSSSRFYLTKIVSRRPSSSFRHPIQVLTSAISLIRSYIIVQVLSPYPGSTFSSQYLIIQACSTCNIVPSWSRFIQNLFLSMFYTIDCSGSSVPNLLISIVPPHQGSSHLSKFYLPIQILTTQLRLTFSHVLLHDLGFCGYIFLSGFTVINLFLLDESSSFYLLVQVLPSSLGSCISFRLQLCLVSVLLFIIQIFVQVLLRAWVAPPTQLLHLHACSSFGSSSLCKFYLKLRYYILVFSSFSSRIGSTSSSRPKVLLLSRFYHPPSIYLFVQEPPSRSGTTSLSRLYHLIHVLHLVVLIVTCQSSSVTSSRFYYLKSGSTSLRSITPLSHPGSVCRTGSTSSSRVLGSTFCSGSTDHPGFISSSSMF